MTSKSLLQELLELSPAQRIEPAQDLWDSIADEAACPELTEAQRRELDRRLAAYERNPHAGSPWEQVKARLQERR